MVLNLWFTPERKYNFKKKTTSFNSQAMIQGYHEYKDIGKLKSAINFDHCQMPMSNPYEIYTPIMQPTSLLVTITVLTVLNIHWDQVNYCRCLP